MPPVVASSRRHGLFRTVQDLGLEATQPLDESLLTLAGLLRGIWRKLSFGTQSAHGSRFVATILTVVETCRQQSRNVFDYLTSAMQAHYAQESAPSLLPGA